MTTRMRTYTLGFRSVDVPGKSVQKIHLAPEIPIVVTGLRFEEPPKEAYLIEFHAGGVEHLKRHKIPLYIFSEVALPVEMEHRIGVGERVSLHVYNHNDSPISFKGYLICEPRQ